jgi:hypothetical protein
MNMIHFSSLSREYRNSGVLLSESYPHRIFWTLGQSNVMGTNSKKRLKPKHQGILNSFFKIRLTNMDNLSPMENYSNSEDTATSKRLLFLYLIPVLGFFPSLWTLYRRQGSREQLTVSRLSITLSFTWMLGYLFLTTGAATSDFFTLRLLILNSFFTSGYFLVSVWLIFRLIQGKSYRLPGFSNLAERMLRKY